MGANPYIGHNILCTAIYSVWGNRQWRTITQKEIETVSVKLQQILTHVDLSVSSTKGCLCLSAQDNQLLQIAVSKLQCPSSNKKKRKTTETSTDDGRRVIVVDALTNETAHRRSTRNRRVILHECV